MSNTLQFKAIETKYDGYHFRSRLEARWAVFFNTLGIAYQYEPEGYILNGTPYLPDFYLSEDHCFVEIKGKAATDEEIQKARLLASFTETSVYIFSGNIGKPEEDDTSYSIQAFHAEAELDGLQWVQCLDCKELWIGDIGFNRCPYCQKTRTVSNQTPELSCAYEAARSARFEGR